MTERDEAAGLRLPGPRHAAPRRGSRLRGRAFALAAVPTALLMGAIPTLASADTPKNCASAPDTVLEETPVPKSELTPLPGTQGLPTSAPTVAPPRTPVTPGTPSAVPTPAPTGSAAATTPVSTPSPSGASQGAIHPNGIIDDIVGIFLPPKPSSSPSPSPTPSRVTPPPAPAATPAPATSVAPRAATPTTAPSPTAPSPTARPSGSAKAAAQPKSSASASASPSANPNCTVDTRSAKALQAAPGHVVPEQNWTLRSTRLALHGSVFNGVYDVRTPTGTKRVLKFTTASVDIENLDMSTIQIPGKTFHVKSNPGSTSTMRQGPVTMYVESLSGHLAEVLGLPIPIDLGEVTLTPDTLPKWLWDLLGTVPIPLDLTLTQAKAVQAGQFGGTLKIPGMRLFNDTTPY
ncbi:hypothetical protein KCMC57_up23530 [Kitasatospora sp. CMC57]|uniref:DUF2993 domain-containing protein n=1 Tax=Kitasatospora sp. CMC57 TaxID=3231513 RepID=A0AB33K226_9ACTN